jgi:prevent-host-death family protein
MRVAPITEVKTQFSAFVKASEEEPVVLTRNGKRVAVLLGITDEDEMERLILAYSSKFQAMLERAAQRIRETGGIRHEEFWKAIESDPA